MFRQSLLAAAVSGLWLTSLYPALAAAQPQQPAVKPAPKSEPIYGYGMMSPQERDEYSARMRNARSAQERQSIRDEHHTTMQARARERGVTLPDRPRGAGPGARGGPPESMGPGSGPRAPGMGPRGPGYGPGERKGPPG